MHTRIGQGQKRKQQCPESPIDAAPGVAGQLVVNRLRPALQAHARSRRIEMRLVACANERLGAPPPGGLAGESITLRFQKLRRRQIAF